MSSSRLDTVGKIRNPIDVYMDDDSEIESVSDESSSDNNPVSRSTFPSSDTNSEDPFSQKSPTKQKIGNKSKIGIVIAIVFVVILVIVLSVLGGLGYFSSAPESTTCNPAPANATLKADCTWTCNSGYTQVMALDGTKSCELEQQLPSTCGTNQELVNNQCVAKCSIGQIRTLSGCACPPGSSGTNCMIVDTIGGTKVDSSNGYSLCKGSNLIWNGYRCLNKDSILSCPLSAAGGLECHNYNNVYYIHDKASSDPYQCYNGIETADGKVFGSSGSYDTASDRCMFGTGGATNIKACEDLATNLDCKVPISA